MTDDMIYVQGLHKSFGKLKVLDGIALRVGRGTTLALLGPNGSGKTTMVRIFSTLLKADSGAVRIGGYDVVKEAGRVRSVIGLTGQYAAVDEYLTGRENLHMMGRLYRLSRSDTKKRTEELLEKFGLLDAANRYVRFYSGGMRRRLDLAASLIATPPVLFLDEPTTALDPSSRLEVWGIIEDLVRQGTTILLTTQHLEEADRLADHIVVIKTGKVLAEGTPDELKNRVGTQRILFTFNDSSELARALALLVDDGAVADAKLKRLSVPYSHGVQSIRRTLEKLDNSGIEISALSCSKPTLDDVFIELTGKHNDHNDSGRPSPERGTHD